MKRAGFPPEIIARLASELARGLQSAAADLAQSLGASGTGLPGTSNVTIAQAGMSAAAVLPDDEMDVGGAANNQSYVAKAYQSVMEDSQQGQVGEDGEDLLKELKELARRARSLAQAQLEFSRHGE